MTGPTVSRLRIGRELRGRRERAGVAMADAAALLRRDPSSISKVETGNMTLTPAEVEALLRLYGLTDADEIERVVTIAVQARKRSAARVPDWMKTYVGLEQEADVIKVFQIDTVPGLLQTGAYTEAVTRAADPARPPAEVQRLVRIRAERQERLQADDPPQLRVVMHEAAVHTMVADEQVVRDQFDRLAELDRLPNVSIRILRFADGFHSAMGTPFSILRVPDPPTEIVCLEDLWSAQYFDRPAQVSAYNAVFDRLCAMATGTLRTIIGAVGESGCPTTSRP